MANNALDDLFSDEDFAAPPVAQAVAAPAPKAKPTVAEAAMAKAPTNVMSTPSVSLIKQAAAKLSAIEREMNNLFLEREDEIRSIIVGLVAGRHVLLLGPPGTGKSALAYEIASRIDQANYFQTLLNQTTDPSELLGPFSLKELENDRFVRRPAGRLPEAHVAFIDEIYKGNSAALNILLPILNERIWYNDGKPSPVPLEFVIAASNEEPQDDNLGAFHDRFPFRHWVDYVRDSGNQARMIRLNIERRNPNSLYNANKTTISLQELHSLRAFAQTVQVKDAVIQAFQKVTLELEKKGLVISDRRKAVCFELIQASAAMEGRQDAMTDDFMPLISVLWQRKDDVPIVQTEILKLANPFEEKMRRLMDQARQMFDDTMAQTKPADKANSAIDTRDNLAKIEKQIEKMIKEALSQGRDASKLERAKQQINDLNQEVVQKCLMMASPSDDSDDEDAMPF